MKNNICIPRVDAPTNEPPANPAKPAATNPRIVKRSCSTAFFVDASFILSFFCECEIIHNMKPEPKNTSGRGIKNYLLESILAILLFAMAFGAPYTPWGVPYPWDLICTIIFTFLAVLGLPLFVSIWLTAKRKQVRLHWRDYLFGAATTLAVFMGIVCLILYFV